MLGAFLNEGVPEMAGIRGEPRSSAWLTRFTLQPNLYKRAVEPGALYRGVLYGATLAILALTSDARQGELMQVSADRFEPPRPWSSRTRRVNRS